MSTQMSPWGKSHLALYINFKDLISFLVDDKLFSMQTRSAKVLQLPCFINLKDTFAFVFSQPQNEFDFLH